MQRYRTKYWQRLREEPRDLDAGFAKHLRECARPRQIAYQRLMSMCQGNPIGLECKSETREGWGFILPDVSGEYPWRIQAFDADGFIGHNCYNTLEDATEALIGDGYRIPDPGALDRCSTTLRWAIGTKRAEFRTLFNRGLLNWTEMLDKMSAVTPSMVGF